jgi:hypothetical protein
LKPLAVFLVGVGRLPVVPAKGKQLPDPVNSLCVEANEWMGKSSI